jgi:hypothetical protein
MKSNRKIFQKFLLIVVSSFLLFQPALNDPCVIAEIAIFYPAPAFEIAHWEALFSQARQSNYQGLLIVPSLMSILIPDLINQVSRKTSSVLIPPQQSISLRC